MDFSAILRLLPTIMKAVAAVETINEERRSGASMMEILQRLGPQVIDLVTRAGTELFPNLPQQERVEAGAVRLDPQLTKKIQGQLNKLGAHPKLAEDGDYGRLTKAAVEQFQGKNDLDVDGWAGPLTQRKLDEKAPT